MKLNLPVILLKGTVLMPYNEIKLEFEDEPSKSIIDESELFHNNKLFVVTVPSLEEEISIKSLPKIGIIAHITRKLLLPNGKVRISLKGLKRGLVIEYLNPNRDSIESIIEEVIDEKLDEDEEIGNIKKLRKELEEYIDNVPNMSNSLEVLIQDKENLSEITDIIVNHMPIDNSSKLKYLKETSSIKRTKMLLEDIYKEEQLFNIEKHIDSKVKRELDKDQKDFYLKEKIKVLKSELGEISPKEVEVSKLKEKLEELNINDTIKDKIRYEIVRYENMSVMSPEVSIVRNYIDIMLNLPWNTYTSDIEDLNQVLNSLDESHFGLKEAKERIIEYLAIKKQSNNINTPIICLVGPPGVGKTTFAYSVAKSLGRKFVKISVGGLDDEGVIKGHIRTYIGATYGKIIDGIKRSKSSNPVFLIDEIDKMGSNYKGDPASALLEVLDTNQNKYFKDNYIDEEYDLSKVLFITTANSITTIPEALRDRLEIINISGYTELEKLEIAKNYLIPVICKSHGTKNIKIKDEDILNIIRYYTKESGLRELERMISKIVRKVVTNKIKNNKRLNLTINNIEEYLGKRIYDIDKPNSDIGIVNGLAYTNTGGDILPIEVNHFKGNGNLIITGSLGDVMVESAKVALSYVKSNYKAFGIDYKLFDNDIHINVPNIAIKKEGPSAGITLVTAIISDLTNLKIRDNIAFTGEITLRGNVIKIGSLKEKVIGAYINNIKTIFIPFSNLSDLEDINDDIKNKIEFIPVKRYDEIYKYLMGENNGR